MSCCHVLDQLQLLSGLQGQLHVDRTDKQEVTKMEAMREGSLNPGMGLLDYIILGLAKAFLATAATRQFYLGEGNLPKLKIENQ